MTSYDDLRPYRTTWDIVLSCFVTILLCTWTVVHPNISYSFEKKEKGHWSKFIHDIRLCLTHRLPTVILIIIFPEFVLRWAMKQSSAARAMLDYTNEPGWSKTHYLFAIMGGFYFHNPQDDSDQPFTPVNSVTIGILIRSVQGRLPSQEDLDDRSTRNMLTTTLVLVQVSWFIIQSISRGITSIHLTKLEILTIGYIMICMIIQLMWWDKPRNITQPIRIELDLDSGPLFKHQRLSVKDETPWMKLFDEILGWGYGHLRLLQSRDVPMFYTGGRVGEDEPTASLAALMFGGIFAGITCIAWSYQSPSLTELVGWRLCSLALCGTILLFLAAFAVQWVGNMHSLFISFHPSVFQWPVFFLTFLYIISRILLITLALMELRNLPLDAYEEVPWTALIPHV